MPPDVLAHIRLESDRRSLATASRAQSIALQDGDPLRAAAWLGQAGLVCEGVERLARVVLLAETVADANPARELRVVQLPHVADDRWVALELPGERAPTASLALVLHDLDDADLGTTAWRISMGRRKFFRVRGLVKMTVLLASTLAGYNLDRIRSFLTRRAEQAQQAGGKRSRAKRRQGTWSELLDVDLMASGPDPLS